MSRPYITYPYLATGGTVARTSPDRWADLRSVKDFGVVGDGVADDTNAIQAAIDHVYADGGGVVSLPSGEYKVSVSSLDETYDNAGVSVPANTNALVLRSGVSLIGTGPSTCKFLATDPTKTFMAMIAPDGNIVQGFEVAGSWTATGAGHGILTLSTAGGADSTSRNLIFRDLYIHDVASYGIGLQAGEPTNCRVENVTVENNGADGLDLKARTDTTVQPIANHCSNITVRNHGRRVTGSAGVDVRGVWHLNNISVTEFGGDAGLDYVGVRFRTKPAPTEAYPEAAAKSSLTGFFVRPTPGAAAASLTGIECGSDHVHVSNGVMQDCKNGVTLSGNVNGSSEYATFDGVTSIDATEYGFFVGAGAVGVTFKGCTSIGSVTAGFRNEGTATSYIGCRGVGDGIPLSTSSAALPTELVMASYLSDNEYGIAISSSALQRVEVSPRGPSTDIDLALVPKAGGRLRFGTLTASADAPITGYILIKDNSGTTRKLAVIA